MQLCATGRTVYGVAVRMSLCFKQFSAIFCGLALASITLATAILQTIVVIVCDTT